MTCYSRSEASVQEITHICIVYTIGSVGLIPALIWNCPSEIAISRGPLINDTDYTGVLIDDTRN